MCRFNEGWRCSRSWIDPRGPWVRFSSSIPERRLPLPLRLGPLLKVRPRPREPAGGPPGACKWLRAGGWRAGHHYITWRGFGMPRADRRGGGPDRAVPPPGVVPPGRALWAGWGRLADLPDSTAALHRSPIEALGLQAPLLANMSWVRPSGPALCSSTPPVKNLPVIPVIPVKPPRACEHSLRPSRVDQRQGRFYWYYWYYWQVFDWPC